MGGYQSKVIFDCQLDGLVTLSGNHFPFRALKTFYFDFKIQGLYSSSCLHTEPNWNFSNRDRTCSPWFSNTQCITSLSELLIGLIGGTAFVVSLVQWNLHISGCNLSLVPIVHFESTCTSTYRVHISGLGLVKN